MKGAVLTVGGSPEPIVKALTWHPAEHVLFVVSERSRGQIEEVIVPRLRERPQYEIALLSQPDDLASCYQECRRQLRDWRERWKLTGNEVYFDNTGGTKPMSAALTLAAVEWIPTYHYVTGERDKGELGVVITGTERSVKDRNPWFRLGLKYREAAMHFYEGGHVEQAAELLERAAESADEQQQTLQALAALCRILAKLDRLNVRNLSHELSRWQPVLQAIFEQTRNQEALQWLKELRSHLQSLQWELGSDDAREHPAALRELLACARRRACQAHYDDAVARLYRAVELFAQGRLGRAFGARLGVIRLDALHPELAARLREKFPTRLSEDGRSLKLGLRDDFQALEFSPHEEDRNLSAAWQRLDSVLQMRNQSWLAHGIRPASKEDFERMWRTVLETLGIPEAEIPEWPRISFDV